MAKIVLNDTAPSGEVVGFSFGNEERFDLGGSAKKALETDNPVLIANALVHPWLDVIVPDGEASAPVFHDRQVRPEDDKFSSQHPDANKVNDPKEVKKALAARDDLDPSVKPVAIDAGRDQDKAESGPVAETLAADPEHEGAKSAPRKATTNDGDKS